MAFPSRKRPISIVLDLDDVVARLRHAPVPCSLCRRAGYPTRDAKAGGRAFRRAGGRCQDRAHDPGRVRGVEGKYVVRKGVDVTKPIFEQVSRASQGKVVAKGKG